MITETMKTELADIKRRFVYTLDPKLDKWKIHKELGKIRGDCEDFALTLLWQLSGRSMLRFWWNLLTLRACIWYVTSYNGVGHAVLWYRGHWADNMERGWYQTADMRHTRRFPWLPPMIAVKLVMARLV